MTAVFLFILIIAPNFGNCGEKDLQSENVARVITKLIPQNLPPHLSFLEKGGNFAPNFRPTENSKYFPEIRLDNSQSSSWHVHAKCWGQRLTSMSAIQCDSPEECLRQISCFDGPHDKNNSNSLPCPKDKIIHRGKKCPISNGPRGQGECLSLEDRRWQISSGLVECRAQNLDGGGEVRNVQQFFKGTNHFFELVQSREFQVKLQVKEEDSSGPISYVGTPIFYTNTKISVHCRATKFLFKDFQLNGHLVDGSTFEIDPNLTGNEGKYWSQFYLEANTKNFQVFPDLAGFSCAVQWRESGEWIVKSFELTTSEPTVPIIDKSKPKRTNEGEGDFDCRYTGGPAVVQLIRDIDGRDVVDGKIKSHGEVRGQGISGGNDQSGNFTCVVRNSLGEDAFSFHQEIPVATTNHGEMIQISWGLTILLFLIFSIGL